MKKLNKKNNLYKLVSKGLELKGVKNWYYDVDTALKFNMVIYGSFILNYVISDKLYRNKPININNRKFKFIKLKLRLLTFGIIKNENGLKYSNLEKTILNFTLE